LNRFVLDASVALAWFVDQPVPDYAVRVRSYLTGRWRAVVPAYWHLEIANVFAVLERRSALSHADASLHFDTLDVFLRHRIETEPNLLSARAVYASARASGLAAYEAVYLDLSREKQLPLATLDQQLRLAASRAGVSLLN
jgi:predicted nucleic acid-binding protein